MSSVTTPFNTRKPVPFHRLSIPSLWNEVERRDPWSLRRVPPGNWGCFSMFLWYHREDEIFTGWGNEKRT